MRRSRFIWVAGFVILLAVCVAAGLAACGSSGGSGGGGNASEIKIGALYPLTGDLAKFGNECLGGVKLAVKEINDAGGIKSLGGAKFKLVEADSQGKPDVGISEVERLVEQDNVSVILGTYQSSVALPATQASERLQTPFLITTAVADDITGRGYKYVFRICPKADWYAKDMVEFCKALPELGGPTVKKVGIIHEDTDFGQSNSEGQIKYAKEAGIEVVANIAYPASSADLTTQVSKLKAANPDIVFSTTYLNDAILIAQAREKLGMKQLFLDAAGGPQDPQFVKSLGQAAETWMVEMEFAADASDVAKDLNATFKTAYGSNMTGSGMGGYQGVYVLAKALEDTGSTDRAKLRDALANVKLVAGTDRVVMATDQITFSPDGQITEAPLYITQVQNGQMVTVFPTSGGGKLLMP